MKVHITLALVVTIAVAIVVAVIATYAAGAVRDRQALLCQSEQSPSLNRLVPCLTGV